MAKETVQIKPCTTNSAVRLSGPACFCGHTFAIPISLARELLFECSGERNIGLYFSPLPADPCSGAKAVFPLPVRHMRLLCTDYRPARRAFRVFRVRPALRDADGQAVNRLYRYSGMLPMDQDTIPAATWAGLLIG
jgi:hypothetical protein